MAFDFNEECLDAFLRLKEVLISAHLIQALDLKLPFEFMCDASDFVLGATLGQRKDNKPYAIYYAIRTLDKAQINYATIEKKFLVVVFALEKF